MNEDVIYDLFDDLFLLKKFDEADWILANLDVSKMTTDEILAVLTVTLAAKKRLKNREQFLNRSKTLVSLKALEELSPNLFTGLE